MDVPPLESLKALYEAGRYLDAYAATEDLWRRKELVTVANATTVRRLRRLPAPPQQPCRAGGEAPTGAARS